MKKIQGIQKIWAFNQNNWYDDTQNQMKKKKQSLSSTLGGILQNNLNDKNVWKQTLVILSLKIS